MTPKMKVSEMFEGKNSSLYKTYQKATTPKRTGWIDNAKKLFNRIDSHLDGERDLINFIATETGKAYQIGFEDGVLDLNSRLQSSQLSTSERKA
jgi:hypothetical protein